MDSSKAVLAAVLAVLAIATLVAALFLLVKLIRYYLFLRRQDIPLSNKLTFWVAAVYAVSPVDLLPDPMYLDDIGILLAALHALGKAVRRVRADEDMQALSAER